MPIWDVKRVKKPILEIDADQSKTPLPEESDCLESLVQRAKERRGVVLGLKNEAIDRLRGYDTEIEGLDRMVAAVEGSPDGSTTLGSPEPLVSASPRPLRQPKLDDPLAEAKDLTDLEVDLTGAKNLAERIIRVAMADKNKVLNVTQLSHCIIRNGGSGGTLTSLRRQVSRDLKENPELFEPVAVATYRYRGEIAEPSAEAVNLGGSAAWQEPQPHTQEVRSPNP